MYQKYFKRMLDLVLSLIALVLLSPVMLIVSILVKINLGSPVIFKQERPGLNGKIFTLYKFRSMKNEVDKNGVLLPNEKRITPFGRRLRSTSLDELPELINIIKGDMSIIGPRPLLTEYLAYYTEEQSRRHNVRPGLTGVSAISGRASLSWDEQLEKDVWYVDNISFLLDLKIIFKTFITVFKRENITSDRGKFSDAKKQAKL
jgi:lipopolysaccharide/colanic/teichoic acid biosynthesis glycosyltransferase